METKEFDENDAIAFIRNYVPNAIKNKYSDDDILLLIDTMFDYFEKGDEDEILYDDDVVDENNINEIVNYVKKNLRKDPDNQIEVDDIKYLIVGYYLGFVYQKGMDDRLSRLEKATSYLESFLDVLKRMEILQKDETAEYERYIEYV